MLTARSGCAIGSVFALAGALGACVPPPPAQPTVMAVPGRGKSYDQFQQDDGYCRQTASNAIGGVNPGAAATQNGVASAAIGTGLGAAAGALIGSASGHAGAGAAIGAGSGLLFGSAVGAGNAQATGASIQHQYNMVYAQCMVGHGDQVDRPYRPYYGYGGPGPYGGPPPGYEGGPPPDDQGGPPPGYQGGPPPGYQGGPPPGYNGGPPPGYDQGPNGGDQGPGPNN